MCCLRTGNRDAYINFMTVRRKRRHNCICQYDNGTMKGPGKQWRLCGFLLQDDLIAGG